MRDELASLLGKKVVFEGLFQAWGRRPGTDIKTACFCAVEHEGKQVADHVWVQYADNFVPFEPRHGEPFRFAAAVMRYRRRTGEVDYTLCHPTQVQCLSCPDYIPPSLVREEPIPEPPPVLDEPLPVGQAPRLSRFELVRGVSEAVGDLGWKALERVLALVEAGGVGEVREVFKFLKQ